jgi:hypothetical protein
MKLGDYTTIVKEMIDDTAATVDQRVIDSVNHLSNIFSIPSTDTSQSTAIGGTTLTVPTNSVKVQQVFIAGLEVLPLENLTDMQDVLDESEQRWYIANGAITFTQTFTTIETTAIWYEKGFTTPTAGVDTDLPTRYNELVYVGAVARYYDKLVAMVITNRQKYPDVKPEEIKDLRKEWYEQYNYLIKSVKLNGYAL